MILEDITTQVTQIVKEQLQLAKTPNLSDRLKDDLYADSLDLINIIMECEKEFDLILPDEGAEKIITVTDLVNLVSTCHSHE